MNISAIKANGIHYTPTELANFLANVTAEHIPAGRSLIALDPACGDGALLFALAQAVPDSVRGRLELVGYDTNPVAIEGATSLLGQLDAPRVSLHARDFLEVAAPAQHSLLETHEDGLESSFDIVISNPPYVRTQVLGSERAQELAQRFGLTGRVDLYHAFVMAMTNVLRPGGVLGLLTSNRFLTIKSGATLRQLLSGAFDLHSVFDLGDTRLFPAAVLPAIVVGRKTKKASGSACQFNRVYEHRGRADIEITASPSVLEAIRDEEVSGLISTPGGIFRIERGLLSEGDDDIWMLATGANQDWLATVNRNCAHSFDDIAKIRVGIKTTADKVFVRGDWNQLPARERPEVALLHPLIRHYDAARWVWSGVHTQMVLYPHFMAHGRRAPIDLRAFPGAERYLELHRERLTNRHYVIAGGRQWYEIWVPHNPAEWAKPKIVFPDIAEEPRFFLDTSGAIVNGDCYWITLKAGFESDHLMLMLAVANSSFITKYYDIAFHNKLYAGRRRFMAQYVKRFPLPDITSPAARRAVRCVRRRVALPATAPELEEEIDELVWKSFGLVKEFEG